MGREVRAQEQYNDRNLQLESTVCPSYKHERSNSISRRILERVPQTQMFPPRKKKKSTAGRQPYQHSKKTTKKKAKVIDKTSREQTQQRLVKMVGDGTKQITTEGKK